MKAKKIGGRGAAAKGGRGAGRGTGRGAAKGGRGAKGGKGKGGKKEKSLNPDNMDDDLDAFMGRDVQELKKEQLLAQLDADMDMYATTAEVGEVVPEAEGAEAAPEAMDV